MAKKYVYFKEYDRDCDDKWVEISQEEFDILFPHESDLSRGTIVNDAVGKIIFDDNGIYDRDDQDFRKSETDKIPDDDYVVIAIC